MNIKLEILQYNYWEHFKAAKDHPKRIKLQDTVNLLIDEILNVKPN